MLHYVTIFEGIGSLPKRQFPVALPFNPSGFHCGDDMKKQIQKVFDDHKPPVARLDKNEKVIFVTYDFNLGLIPKVRLKADYETWIDLDGLDPKVRFKGDYKTWIELDGLDHELSKFETIKPYLSRTSPQTIERLKEYAKVDPLGFLRDVDACINCTHGENPLYRKKPRGGSPYGLEKTKMWEIRNTARHLYICLKNNIKNPAYKQPEELKILLKLHGIEPDKKKLREITLQIIKRIFDFRPEVNLETGENPSDVFYKKHIAYRPLKNISNSKRINSFTGSPYLVKALAKSYKLNLKAHK